MSRLVLMLTRDEIEQLKRLATQNLRKPQDQARYMLRSVLLSKQTQGNEKPATGLVYEAETVSGFTVSQPL